MKVCYHCFDTSNRLEAEIRAIGAPGSCPTCGTDDTVIAEASDLEGRFEPLTELYAVAMHGEHYIWDKEEDQVLMGDEGEPLDQLLQNDWPIFSDKLAPEEIRAVLEEVWSDYDATALYAGEELWYEPPDRLFQSLAETLMHRRRFFVHQQDDFEEINIDRILGSHLELFSQTIMANEIWCRGRLHHRTIGPVPPKPYDISEMGAPRPEKVNRAGRANPAGIAYLYLASDLDTVIAELRAEPEDYVSVGQFKIDSDLNIINLETSAEDLDPFAFSDLRGEIERRSLLREFQKWLSRHVRDELHEIDYVVTQYLAEYILSRGYDGIRFKSSLAAGSNLVLFHPPNATSVGVKQFQITSMHIDYSQKEITESDRDPDTAFRSL